MSPANPKHILTAVAWPYANGPRHIGHVAGFGVPSDIFSRYQRMAGNKVLMVSGTDEHGTPIQVQADKEGVTARELADRNNGVIAKDLRQPGRDLRPVHPDDDEEPLRDHAGDLPRPAQERVRLPEGQLGAISPSTGRTLPDRYIEGTCPICGYPSARGDQCDNCGNQLDPIDLINPRSQINGETPKFVETEQFFLDLPAFADALGELAEARKPLAAERAEVLPQPARRPEAAGDHPRPRLGHPGAARRLARPPRQVDLRLVRRGDRLPVGLDRVGPPHRRPGRLAGLVARRERRGLLLHGQGQHRLPRRDLAGDAVRLLRERRQGRHPGPARRAQPAVRGGVQ